jgi:uncharacterized protein YtpQ (UPF0354 family)
MDENARTFCMRSVAYLKSAQPEGQGQAVAPDAPDSPVLRDLGNGLLITYVVDEGDHFTYVQNRHLAQARLSADILHEQALLNLSSMIGSQAEVRKFGSVYLVLAGGCFEASLILCDEFWSAWYADLTTDSFIASFPARDVLAFGDSSASNTIAELKALSANTAGAVHHPITPTLYRRDGKRWTPLFSH